MSKENDGGPAFPQDLQGRRGDDPDMQGMSLRDWFAGQAIAGLALDTAPEAAVAEWAYTLAGAMLEARKK